MELGKLAVALENGRIRELYVVGISWHDEYIIVSRSCRAALGVGYPISHITTIAQLCWSK